MKYAIFLQAYSLILSQLLGNNDFLPWRKNFCELMLYEILWKDLADLSRSIFW